MQESELTARRKATPRFKVVIGFTTCSVSSESSNTNLDEVVIGLVAGTFKSQ